MYDADRRVVEKIRIGTVSLKQGDNRLVFELENYPGKENNINLGLDKLVFEK
ncbi:MAG: hypothetical protein LBT78_01940 [Tannerella sp.]|nr:hypothetical protein [Tannerella sp.]